jgi:hypothetical protein
MVVEITYRGIRVAQGKLEGDGDPGFLPFEAPLPVGTRVMVYSQEGPPREAIITQVVEQDSSAKSPPGMKLRWAPAPAVLEEHTATTIMHAPPVLEPEEPELTTVDAVPEPADSSARTIMMPAVTELPPEVEPADSPRRTLTNMPAITDPDRLPEGDNGGKKRRRRR